MRYEVFFNHVVENDWSVKHIPFQKKHKTLPVILTSHEVKVFLSVIEDPKYFAIASTLYGSGLRLSECLNLKIEDIDSANMVITVRDFASFICHSSIGIRRQSEKDTGHTGASVAADHCGVYPSGKRFSERSYQPS